MKRDVENFIAKCIVCQQVKVEHLRPGGMSQEIESLIWKWEMINMDLNTGLSRPQNQYNFIWVIADRITKLAHFLPVRTNYSTKDYTKLFLQDIVKSNGVPISFISNHNTQFSSYF